jgi:Tc toxin complex TcA C-terminal TcB-binding domain
MSSLIVIRITPQSPVDAITFGGYLNPSLGPLTITAYSLSYDSVDDQPLPGTKIAPSAVNNSAPATAGWTYDPNNGYMSFSQPAYPGGVTTGIFQQVDFVPGVSFDGDYALESVATAVIEIPSALAFENLRIVAKWGSQTIPVAVNYHDVALGNGPTPDISTWTPFATEPDPWGQLAPSFYLSLPAPPTAANPFSLQLSTDGTPPNFDELLTAVNAVLADDPGAAVNATPVPAGTAGSNTLIFASTTGITVGMAATAAGIPNGTTVLAVNSGTGVVTFSQEFSAAVPGPVAFTPSLAALTFEQCQNIAYEIVWSQQPPLPTPPSTDTIENLYTNPPNDGSVMNSGSPNPYEGDREQFESQLKSYYAVADTTADQLTNFVFALSAAVACEQMSLAANVAMLEFPVNPGQASTSPLSEAQVILTAVNNLTPSNFGVPAGYFYALAATMPVQQTALNRYSNATGRQIEHILTNLTTAINAQTITDSEAYVTAGPASINAAQAARQIVALGVPAGSATALAPLDTMELLTSADAASGSVLIFNSAPGVNTGMFVSGPEAVPFPVAPNTTVLTVTTGTPTTITLSQPLLDDLPLGATVIFTPPYSVELSALIQSWLNFPTGTNLPTGGPSSQAYQPTDDATHFWPGAANAQPDAFLSLVLSALTQGYMIPAPINVSLGDQIVNVLLKPILNPPTVATLASVTEQQWSAFFKQYPTYLPQPSTGNITAQIEAFVANVKKFFTVASEGPSSAVILATNGPTGVGLNTLSFASTNGLTPPTFNPSYTLTWTVTDATNPSAIPAGTTVQTVAGNTVGLSGPVVAPGVSSGDNIIFTPSYSGASQEALPQLPLPSVSPEWLQACLAAYTGAFAGFGGADRFNIPLLQTIAATVFGGDPAAQNWAVDALVTLDSLYLVLVDAALGVTPNLEFSIVEALYARGFKSAADITDLSASEFQQALLGTVAYDYAAAIYAGASLIAPPSSSTATCGTFHPVNPGSLTNCIPPDCISPLGPVAYLNEMLQVSPGSTCENPLTPTASNTLGSAVSARRGPIGTLLASCANLETQLPLVDIANECLEYLGSVSAPANGTIYQTPSDSVDDLPLWHEEPCEKEREPKPPFHDPNRVFAALPEYSTPAPPVSANSAVDPTVYNKLKCDFSSCDLPYSQAIDVSRTYLRHLRSCRFEEMRTFRKCITEFVLDPANEPAGFQSYLWRLPIRTDIAIEYLGITPEEYKLLFQGSPAPPCASANVTPPPPTTVPGNPNTPGSVAGSGPSTSDEGTSNSLACWQLYGFPNASDGNGESWTEVVSHLPEFLRRTCLSYCEFIELWKSGYVPFCSGCEQTTTTGPNTEVPEKAESEENGGDGQKSKCFPDCEPCCLEKFCLQFPQSPGAAASLCQLAVFIRLWRKLKESHCFCYSFAHLRDICDVLQLYKGGAINPDFIRELAAFQMLRDLFHMELADPHDRIPATAVDADRTQLLALWVGPTATKWNWAVKQLIEKVERYAQQRNNCDRRSAEFVKLLVSNLDPLSSLCGFTPASATDNWHASPTRTLRFAEVLAKIYASNFSVGELIYLFTVQEPLDGDDPFPLQEQDEALDLPLGLPEDEKKFSLSELRRTVLEARVDDEEIEKLNWKQIEAALQEDFGFAQSSVLALGQHFFPETLERAGYSVSGAARRYFSGPLTTSAAMWNTPADGPFQYDPTANQLWTQLPLTDEAVIAKLTRVHSLTTPEQTAVQDLYFHPRAMLAAFALLFSDFSSAEKRLIEEKNEHERWNYFRHQFAICQRRCRIIAEHLERHVAAATGQKLPEGESPAVLILRRLFADENIATAAWENNGGTTPNVTWTPPPNGGALAALLGIGGNGLIADYKPEGGPVVWRCPSGPLSGFGHELDKQNCPVPSVLPAMSATLTPEQMKFVSIHNGFLMKDASGAWLGGGQSFEVKWHGALLVENEGTYEFWGGAPTEGDEKPDWDAAEHRRWRMFLKRGQRTWIPLSHHWLGEEEHRSSSVPLKRGVYELTIELVQPSPEFPSNEQVRAQRTGFQVKYSGPDTDDRRTEIPHHRLFSILKDETLGQGISTLGAGAASFLSGLYISSLRDIRRTYQRAFKALLFAHRFALSARRTEHGTSELGYMLAQSSNFAGAAYYAAGGGYTQHLANFDFNFLPLRDDYHAPTQDERANPSPQRIQAMFDWWERLFDYTAMRREVHKRCDRHVWRLFEEAEEKQPAHPDYLLRHLGADSRHWPLDLRCYQGESIAVYPVTSADLEDDRWTIRAWHADQWLRALQCSFAVKDITVARPDLWAATDPSAVVSGETQTGNANLFAFLCEGCLANGEPRRYEDFKRLNDGLRERGRNALLAYLCHMNRVLLPWGQFAHRPRELSDLLLLDVEAGICEKASRIEEAITAVQNFVLRARLGLEPGWTITHEFARMWDREFATFHVWQACKRRHLYKENWIEWGELEKARGVEAFRFLESKLRSSELTVAVPGGLEWWPDERPAAHKSLEVLQKREPSTIKMLTAPREGLNLIGTPERDARPSWLAAIESTSSSGGTGVPSSPGSASPRTSAGSSSSASTPLPFWMEAAIRLGKRFYRIAAAGVPPAAMSFEPHKNRHGKECVTCCDECRCSHPALVDEYYFWLIDGFYYDPASPPVGITAVSQDDYQYGFQDDYYDPAQQQAAYWQDTSQLPELLEWAPQPMVRLAWCRVHNGEFQQPRRSAKGLAIQVQSGTPTDLTFVGRTADSLIFSVNNGVAPQGYSDPTAPGFRYDLATDNALVLPLLNPIPPLPPNTFVGGLPAYPYFVYDAPGTHLFPLSMFSPSLAIAQALRSHCRFEPALKWYRLAFDPLQCDCTWARCGETSSSGNQGDGPSDPSKGPNALPGATATAPAPTPASDGNGTETNCCCDTAHITCAEARDRAILLHYLETLREWGDAVMRHGHSREALQHARQIFDTAEMILGRRPINVRSPDPKNPPTIANFKPAFAPLNPRLLDLYDVIKDRLDLIRACMDSRRLNIAKGCCDLPYFGNDTVRQGWRTAAGPCAEESEWCHLHSPYRFMFLIQQAKEHAAKTQEIGAALLATFEKGDAESLASLRALFERELLTIGLNARKDQWRDADWQIEALQKTKAASQSNLVYTNGLINAGPEGKIDDELQYENLTSSAISLRGTANITEGIGEAMRFIPDFVLGGAGFGGSPVAISWIPLGTKIGEALEAVARIMNNCAEIDSMNAGYDLTEAQWQRRLNEWTHQTQTLAIDIQRIERQILAAQRMRSQALNQLNSQVRQMEQSAEAENFLRDKFTAHDLYLFLQKETAALYYKSYDLALNAARQAQFAFNLERGHTTRHFIPDCAWDNLHEGLLAGERLSNALRHMEKAYLDENVREYELTKNFSLRLHFPVEYLRLRTTGCCEIEIPEWMFDLDFPGHYMRRIKNVTLTIPCVTGPYTGVHCRMTLLSSMTRIDPRLAAPVHECCCPSKPCDCECRKDEHEDEHLLHGYEPCPDDPRVVRQYAAREAIATSTGQNDSGMFELNFNDERYLPFEYKGAASCWRIELPPENNYFDLNTLSDCIVTLRYTAREGGDLLRRAANRSAHEHLPGDGWCFFDVRHEFPDAWQLFEDRSNDGPAKKDRPKTDRPKEEKRLELWLDRKMFPFVPGSREVWVSKMAILFAMRGEDCRCPKIEGCPCPEHGRPATRIVEYLPPSDHRKEDYRKEDYRKEDRHKADHHKEDHKQDECLTDVSCYATDKWPDLYCGFVDTRVGPLAGNGRRRKLEFRFPEDGCQVERVFLLCRYSLNLCACEDHEMDKWPVLKTTTPKSGGT